MKSLDLAINTQAMIDHVTLSANRLHSLCICKQPIALLTLSVSSVATYVRIIVSSYVAVSYAIQVV